MAEWVPSTQKLSAGTVVVLDATRDNHVAASLKAYDTRVAGVVSAQPGLTLGVAREGKALESLEKGMGEILVLLSLQ